MAPDLGETSGKDRRLWNSCFAVLAALALTFTVGWRPVIGAEERESFDHAQVSNRHQSACVAGILSCTRSCIASDATRNRTAKRMPPVLASQEGSGEVLLNEAVFGWSRPTSLPDPQSWSWQLER